MHVIPQSRGTRGTRTENPTLDRIPTGSGINKEGSVGEKCDRMAIRVCGWTRLGMKIRGGGDTRARVEELVHRGVC